MRSFLAILLLCFNAKPSYAKFDCNPLPETLNQADQLKSFIDQCEIRSIDSLIPLLPSSYRENFALLYRSKAESEIKNPGTVSTLYPRSILFGGDGKLILSFTSHPEKPSYQELQILEFNEESNTTQFKTLHFTSNQVKYDPKPESCKACHGEAQHPIWQQYPKWDGAYGGVDDIVSAEKKDFSQFIQNTKSLGAASRFSAFDQDYLEHQFEQGFYANRHLHTTGVNFRLTSVLSNIIAKQIARKVEASPEFLSYRNLMIWFGYSCHNGILKPQKGDEYYDILKQARKLNPKFDKVIGKGLLYGFEISGDYSYLKSVQDGLHLILGKLGYSSDEHRLSLSPYYSSNYQTGTGQLMNTVVNILLKDMGMHPVDMTSSYLHTDETFKLGNHLMTSFSKMGLMTGEENYRREEICSELKQSVSHHTWFDVSSIVQSRSRPTLTPHLENRLNSTNPFQKCIRCHTGESPVGGLIPFGDFPKLREFLIRDPNLRLKIETSVSTGRMPFYEGRLNDSEQSAIRSLLDKLSY